MNFWDVFGFIFWSYIFITYLMVLFWIMSDLFRDRSLSGWQRAIWIVCLLFFPIITALVYMIARGQGMTERQNQAVDRSLEETGSYIRSVAGISPAAEIERFKALLDSGAISPEEYLVLKTRVISEESHKKGSQRSAAP